MEPVDNTVPYKLGQMDARIGNIESTVAGIQADVKVLLARDAQTKGSKATITGIGAGGVGVGGLIVAALQLWFGDREPVPQHPLPPITIQPTPRDSDRSVSPPTRF